MPVTGDLKTQTDPLKLVVNGAPLDPAILAKVLDVTVEQDVNLPSAFTIRIRDVDDKKGPAEITYAGLTDSQKFAIGTPVQVWMGSEEAAQKIFDGEITSMEMLSRADDPMTLIVKGYDKGHRLTRGRKTRTFLNMTDSDIVSKLAREGGLSAQAGATTAVYPYLIQNNETNWDFLRQCAQRNDFELFVEGSKLMFRKAVPATVADEVTLGTTLLAMRTRVSASPQVNQVVIRGWDVTKKQAVVSTAATATSVRTIGEKNGKILASTFGSAEMARSDLPFALQGHGDHLAQTTLDEIDSSFVQMEGTCIGNAKIAAGKSIKILKVGTRFSGTYYLSAVTHRHSATSGYICEFVVSGRRSMALTTLVGGGASDQSNRYGGVVVGVVSNNKDPDNMGRIKVEFPWMPQDAGKNQESNWARLAMPMAGAERGFFWIPEVNDEVVVAFDRGDPNLPYVVGSVWNGKDKAPLTAGVAVGGDGKVKQRLIKTTSGHTILIDDSPDTPQITITDKTRKNEIKIDSTMNDLLVKTARHMDFTAQGNVTVTAQGSISLIATQDVTITGMNVKIEAKQAFSAKGLTVAIEAQTNADVKAGVNASVKASVALNLEGSATAKLSGAMVDISGQAMVKVAATVVKLN